MVHIPNKTKLVAFLLAALVWIRGPAVLVGVGPAHANNHPKIAPVELIKPSFANEIMLAATKTKAHSSSAVSKETTSSTRVNGKLFGMVSGAVILGPSAGLVLNYLRNNDKRNEKHNDDDDDVEAQSAEKKTFKKPTENNPLEKQNNERRERVQKKMVEDVLNKAKDATQFSLGKSQEAGKQQDVIDRSQETAATAVSSSSRQESTPPPSKAAAVEQQLVPLTSAEPREPNASSFDFVAEKKKPVPPASPPPAITNPKSVAPSPLKQEEPEWNATAQKKSQPTFMRAKQANKPGNLTAARRQPKSPAEEKKLQEKYASIEDLGERAYTILVDLGMIEESDVDDSEGAFQ